MTALIQELGTLYTAKQFGECVERAREALAAEVIDARAFDLAAASFVHLGRRREFAELVGRLETNAPVRIARVCLALLEERAYTSLAALEHAFSRGEPAWLVVTYFSGCALMMMHRDREAMQRFKLFRLAWPRFVDKVDFTTDDVVNVMFRQGRLIADPHESS